MPSSNSALLDEAFRTVEVIGYDKTLQVLREAQYQEIKFEDPRVKSVVELVSKKTAVPVYEILFGNGRKNERKFAIGFCSYYLHSSEFYGMDMEQVKDLLNKDSAVTCYTYAKMITKINPNHIADKKFHDIKKELDVAFSKAKK